MKSTEVTTFAKNLLPSVPLIYRDTVRISDGLLHRFDEKEPDGFDPDRLHIIEYGKGEIKAIAYPGGRWEKEIASIIASKRAKKSH